MPITNELSELDVHLISITCDGVNPANGQGVVLKSTEGYREIVAKIEKTDAKGLLYVTVMKANEPDSDGEITSWEEVEKAAINFLKKGIVRSVDTNHDMVAKENIAVVGSYPDEKEQVWKAILDLSENAEMLQKAKEGKITGVSIYANGKRTPVKKSDKSFFAKMRDFFKTASKEQIEELQNINKNKGEEMDAKEVAEIVKAELAKAEEIKKQAGLEQEKEDLIKSLKESNEKLTNEVLEIKKAMSSPDTPKVGGNSGEEVEKSKKGGIL